MNYSSSKDGADRVVAEIVARGKGDEDDSTERRNGARKSGRRSGQRRHQTDVQRLFADAKWAFSQLDVLVHNAGMTRQAIVRCPVRLKEKS